MTNGLGRRMIAQSEPDVSTYERQGEEGLFNILFAKNFNSVQLPTKSSASTETNLKNSNLVRLFLQKHPTDTLRCRLLVSLDQL